MLLRFRATQPDEQQSEAQGCEHSCGGDPGIPAVGEAPEPGRNEENGTRHPDLAVTSPTIGKPPEPVHDGIMPMGCLFITWDSRGGPLWDRGRLSGRLPFPERVAGLTGARHRLSRSGPTSSYVGSSGWRQ